VDHASRDRNVLERANVPRKEDREAKAALRSVVVDDHSDSVGSHGKHHLVGEATKPAAFHEGDLARYFWAPRRTPVWV
jgi:hypothetical protein